MKLARSLGAAPLLAALLVPASPAIAPAVAASCSIRASIKAPNHTPKINKNWYLTVTASPKIKTHAKYEFLFKSTVVSKQAVLNDKNYTFTGHFRDPLKFPARAAGLPLTVRVVLSNRCGTKNVDWKITPTR